MMAPDYTHWHGTYEIARTFYTHYIPQLEKLAEQAIGSEDPERRRGGEALQAKIKAVLDERNHRWFQDKMDPEEKAARDKARAEFLRRYKK